VTHHPRIVVLGRQGSGKGTQCVRLAAHLGVPHVSTGDLFRGAVRDRSPVGVRVADLLERGELVPDEVVLDLVREHAERAHLACSGYLLDGLPRTVAQAEAFFGETVDLTASADTSPFELDVALELSVPPAEALARIASRRVCPECGWTTTVADGAEAVPCGNGHGGTAVRRSDDSDEAIQLRLDLYERETGPLAPWFEARGQLVRVDGTGAPDDVFARILAAVEPFFDRAGSDTVPAR
jgi:adenylate kinase